MADRRFPEQRPHEARFRPMSPAAKLCWYTLTGILGGSGIAIAYPATLSELTGYDVRVVDDALRELEAQGWLEREGAVMWMRDGLLEQGLNPCNGNHRASVDAHLTSLTAIAPDLVAAYRVHHAAWLQPEPDGTREDTPPRRERRSMGARSHQDSIGIPSGSKEGRRVGGEEAGGTDPSSGSGSGAGGERARARRAAAAPPSAPPADAPPGESAAADTDAPGDLEAGDERRDPDFAPLRAAPLAPLVRRLMRERYGGAARERRRDVARQLAAALSPAGTRIKRGEAPVRTTPAVLARALELALAEPIRDPDKTAVVVLRKLQDGRANLDLDGRGRTPTEAAAADEPAARAAAEREFAAREADALAWLEEHPGDAAETARQVDAQRPDVPGVGYARRVLRVQLVEQLRAELAGASA
jgi:hypothetical protein